MIVVILLQSSIQYPVDIFAALSLLFIYVFNFLVSADWKCSGATGLQLPGILDELFSYDGPLGALYEEETVSLYLWAPTAQVNCIPKLMFIIVHGC